MASESEISFIKRVHMASDAEIFEAMEVAFEEFNEHTSKRVGFWLPEEWDREFPVTIEVNTYDEDGNTRFRQYFELIKLPEEEIED